MCEGLFTCECVNNTEMGEVLLLTNMVDFSKAHVCKDVGMAQLMGLGLWSIGRSS